MYPIPLRSFSTCQPLHKNVSVKVLLEDKEEGFSFVQHNPRPLKPRQAGVTEIRGPYYSVMGKRYLTDVLETMGATCRRTEVCRGLISRKATQR